MRNELDLMAVETKLQAALLSQDTLCLHCFAAAATTQSRETRNSLCCRTQPAGTTRQVYRRSATCLHIACPSHCQRLLSGHDSNAHVYPTLTQCAECCACACSRMLKKGDAVASRAPVATAISTTIAAAAIAMTMFTAALLLMYLLGTSHITQLWCHPLACFCAAAAPYSRVLLLFANCCAAIAVAAAASTWCTPQQLSAMEQALLLLLLLLTHTGSAAATC